MSGAVDRRRGASRTATALAVAMATALAAAPAAVADEPRVIFTDATRDSGIDYVNLCGAPAESKGWVLEGLGAGAAWLDYDGDGNLDLYVVNGSSFERGPAKGEPNRLFKGNGRGRFTDVTRKAGVGDRGWGFGVAVGDYDNDGDPDLYVTNFGPNVLLRNKGDGTFEDVSRAAGVDHPGQSTSAAFFDMEGDGDLDLFVVNYATVDPRRTPPRGTDAARTLDCHYRGIPVACGPLGLPAQPDVVYRNRGDGTFEDATEPSGLAAGPSRYGLAVVTGDYDNDGDQDVYVANDSTPNALWRNRGDGSFIDVGIGTLSGLRGDGRPQANRGAQLGDLDRDGWLDIVVSGFAHDYDTIYRNVEGRMFIDDSVLTGMLLAPLRPSWGVGLVDFDRDGDLDCFLADGHLYPQVDDYDAGQSFRHTNRVLVNEGKWLRDATAEAGAGLEVRRSFRGAAFGDYDNDGDVDVFVTALDDAGLLLRNDSPKPGRWLQLRLVGTQSNRDGVGTRVRVAAGGRTQIGERIGGGSYLSAADPRLHFGLGDARMAEVIEVRWPSGQRDLLREVEIDRLITVREGEGIVP